MCEKCKKPFEVTMTISEGEKAKVACPTCKGTKDGAAPQAKGDEERVEPVGRR